MYKVEFKGFTVVLKKISGILGLSLWERLKSLPHGKPGGIYLSGFGILRQDFWAHNVISITNHRETLPHSLHTQELPFYWPNNLFLRWGLHLCRRYNQRILNPGHREEIFKYKRSLLSTPSHYQNVTLGLFFKRSFSGLNSEFSFS